MPVIQKSSVKSDTQTATQASTALGTKWLSFWNYFCLPVGAVADLVFVFIAPTVVVRVLCLIACPLRVATAIGLHQRRRWGWILNCIMIGLVSLFMLVPSQAYDLGPLFLVAVVIRIILTGFAWIWPNVIYWRKRKHLFSMTSRMGVDNPPMEMSPITPATNTPDTTATSDGVRQGTPPTSTPQRQAKYWPYYTGLLISFGIGSLVRHFGWGVYFYDGWSMTGHEWSRVLVPVGGVVLVTTVLLTIVQAKGMRPSVATTCGLIITLVALAAVGYFEGRNGATATSEAWVELAKELAVGSILPIVVLLIKH